MSSEEVETNEFAVSRGGVWVVPRGEFFCPSFSLSRCAVARCHVGSCLACSGRPLGLAESTGSVIPASQGMKAVSRFTSTHTQIFHLPSAANATSRRTLRQTRAVCTCLPVCVRQDVLHRQLRTHSMNFCNAGKRGAAARACIAWLFCFTAVVAARLYFRWLCMRSYHICPRCWNSSDKTWELLWLTWYFVQATITLSRTRAGLALHASSLRKGVRSKPRVGLLSRVVA